MHGAAMVTIRKNELNTLINSLRQDGYQVIGPTIRDGVIAYEPLDSIQQLPTGWTDHQDAGRYRLKRRSDGALFGYVVGPHSWKKYLFPPRQKIFGITRNGGDEFVYDPQPPDPPRYAFLGVRACELAAIDVQDRVFARQVPDPYYAAARRNALFIAVNCPEPGGTCFCASMDTGPRCKGGFDLALTELRTSFAIEIGSERGRKLVESLERQVADDNTRHLVDLMMQNAAGHMGRTLDTGDLPAILMNRLEHPHWNTVANKCMACANCTLVCPTCFCSNVEDKTDLTGNHAQRWRTWGSCFTLDFSYHTGGYVRSSIAGRYRQWLTHKLAGWHEQFESSGCVGCGRCITWCPVGIDITAEAATIASEAPQDQSINRCRVALED